MKANQEEEKRSEGERHIQRDIQRHRGEGMKRRVECIMKERRKEGRSQADEQRKTETKN